MSWKKNIKFEGGFYFRFFSLFVLFSFFFTLIFSFFPYFHGWVIFRRLYYGLDSYGLVLDLIRSL